jgi:murein L,D-transpeptidase YcbB/YkuD
MSMQALRSTCALAAVIVALGAASAESAPTYYRDLRAMPSRASEAQAQLQNLLQSRGESSPLSAYSEIERAQLMSFYGSRQFRPVWTGGLVEEDRAAGAVAVLGRAEYQGLRSEDYLSSDVDLRAHPGRGRDAMQYEVALTAAVLRYAHDVSVGRTRPNAVYRDVKLPIPSFDSVDALIRMSRSRSIADSLADLAPPHPQYRRLAEAMARYRAVEAKGGWPTVTTRGEKALIERLVADDVTLAAIPEPKSDDIQAAVKRFQSRNGLEDNGRVAGATLAALNVPVSRRIEILAANMERWRWLPRRFEDRYIEVNVPDQSVAFVRNGDVVLSSRVVIGRKSSRTPIVRAEAVALIVNPPWEIPGDIVVNQLLPKLRKSSGYLQASNMVLLNEPGDPFGKKVNWRNVSGDAFPYRIVQIPGPQNALGNLMIDTPNEFDVYLHDTPGKQLFKQADRAVSNGCIRVEQIFQLASLALDESDGETKITDLIAAHDTKRVPLGRPVPVYFLYWTAIAGSDGGVGFRADLYGRDAPLIAALAEPVVKDEELPNVADANPTESVAGATRVSNTLLPATAERSPVTEGAADPQPVNEYGSELPPLDQPGSELPPVDNGDSGASPAPRTDSAIQRNGAADAVRRANDRTQFSDTARRPDTVRTTEPTGLRRSWPDETSRYGRSRRVTNDDGPFPLLRRLFDGPPPRDPYTRRRE